MSERVHSRSDGAGPSVLPRGVLPSGPPLGAAAGSGSWFGSEFGDAVTEMQQRVAARLSVDASRYAGLDGVGKRLRTQALVNEELESWGQPPGPARAVHADPWR